MSIIRSKSSADDLYSMAMTTLRTAFFWSGIGIIIGTLVILLIWPETFGPLPIAALLVSFAMAVLARPWERDNSAE